MVAPFFVHKNYMSTQQYLSFNDSNYVAASSTLVCLTQTAASAQKESNFLTSSVQDIVRTNSAGHIFG